MGKLTCVGKHKLHLQKWEGFYLNLILIFAINLKWKEMLFNKNENEYLILGKTMAYETFLSDLNKILNHYLELKNKPFIE